MTAPNTKYDVAAFVWPSYTGDEPRTRMFWPEGYGEWETVRKATAKYPGHEWPRRPLWGYCNEADPYVMEMQIDAAADHGVNVFIYDWYWYDGRPFLEQCLNNGYLKARNNNRVKFYLMWANHDVNHLWDKRISHIDDNVIWRAALDRREFEVVAKRWIERYFTHPSYYTIDGKPVLMIFHYEKFIEGFGGVEQAVDGIAWFKREARKAGFAGVHMQMNNWQIRDVSGVGGKTVSADNSVLTEMGFDSTTHYQFAMFLNIDREYREIVEDAETEWDRLSSASRIPYFAHVSIGWDNNPRFKEFRPGIVKNNTPEAFQNALVKAKAYADTHPNQPPLITINSWNEWTETSYLEPDDRYGYGYLEAVKKVFGAE